MSEMVNILPYSVDLRQTLEKTDLHTLFVMGDNEAHRFEVEILRGSEKPDLTGSTVTGYFTNFKEDTTVEVAGKVEGGKAVVTLSKPCYTLHGQFVLTIQVKSGEAENTVLLGEGYMRRTKGETIIYDDYIVYDVSTLLAQIEAMEAATKAANTSVSNANNAVSEANTATTRANNAAAKIEGITVSAQGAEVAGATISEVDGVKHIAFDLPKGPQGPKGDPGTIENVTIASINGLLEALGGKAPTNHAAADTTYGVGNNTNYGHVRLLDSYNSTSGANAGIAATPNSVNAVYKIVAETKARLDSLASASGVSF